MKSFCLFGEDPRQTGTGCIREEGHNGAHAVIEADPEDPDYDDDDDEYACVDGYPEHDYPPAEHGNECRRCGAEAEQS